MKPLILKMQAFANYPDEQCIDFTELKGRNMFLITGKTGAGKTTIFDAISYALFGESSGGFRSVDSLRSDYADGSKETYVELEFEVRGETYKVRRKPTQMLNKKKGGEGLTSSSAEAVLEFPDERNPITRISEVNKKIIELLGVNSEQFKQIVMLPQGEFIKFLKASSAEKELIFRKIFGTESFNKIQARLTEKSKSLAKVLDKEIDKRNIYVEKIKAEDGSVLSFKIQEEQVDIDSVLDLTNNLIESDSNSVKKFEEENVLNKTKIKNLENEQRNLNHNINIINSYEENKKAYEGKKVLGETVNEWRVKLTNGRKALNVKVVEDNYKISCDKLSESENLLKKSENEKAFLEQKVEYAKAEVLKEKARENEKQKYILEVDSLGKQEEKVTDYDTKKKEFLKLQGECTQLENQIKRLEISKESEEKTKVECEKYILDSSVFEIKKKEVEQEGKEKKNQIDKIKNLANNFENIRYQKMDIDEKKKEAEKADAILIKAREDYQKAEDLFKKAQAGILAETLVEGEMCPVCGSTEHPHKAIKPSEVPSEVELEKMKLNYEKKDKKRDEVFNELRALNVKIESDYKNIIEAPARELLDILGENFLELEESLKREITTNIGTKLNSEREKLRAEYIELEEKTKLLSEKKERLEKINESLNMIEVSLKNSKPKLEEKNRLYITVQEQVKNIESEIPEELRSLDKIISRKSELNNIISSMTKAYELAEKTYADLSQKYSASIKAIELNKENLEKAKKEANDLKVKFEEILVKEGFELKTYKEFSSITNLDTIEVRIQNYDKELSELKGAFGNAEKEFDKLEIKSLEEIKVELEKVENELNLANLEEKTLQNNINLLNNRIENNKENIEQIIKVTEKIKDKEKEYKNVEHLAKISRGEGGNEKKITFESYILTSYFDEIIAVANQRLGKMTNGRFELRRAEEVKGNGKKGLELNVLDNNTGFVRGINSLSGGESFKAALSIALGLADVIQGYAGGISIETMFIDEGFGTLDPDSLDSAIQCLLDLQSGGRLVGVISHVQELKERIEARLEVTTREDNRGSKAKFEFQ